MDEFNTDIFTFRHSEYKPPSDYLIGDEDEVGDFEFEEADSHIVRAIFGLNHIVWN
jgi:hypothetical protein